MERPQTLEVPGYQVVEYLGSGARSSIWRIRENRTGHSYALKRVVKRHPSDMRYLEQAITEYEVGGRLNHAALRRIHSLRRVKRWLQLREIHLVMEYCPGHTIQERRPRSVLDVVNIFVKVAEGLAHMNSQGCVHADMKPNNVVVSKRGTVKVIDLGQSCQIGTVKTRIQGTPDFIAPEQVQRLPLDTRTDVYNFGATLYWALTGQAIPTVLPKEKGLRTKDMLVAKPVQELNPEVPRPLAEMLTQCIEYQPCNRPACIADVISRLTVTAHRMERAGVATNTGHFADETEDKDLEQIPESYEEA
jgi:serine/threonine-protein kinase